MLSILLLAGQIVSAYPPLSPADAAAVLASSGGLSNRTYAGLVDTDGPTVIIAPSSPTSGPFGEFAPLPPTAPLAHEVETYWPPYAYASPWFGGATAGRTRASHRDDRSSSRHPSDPRASAGGSSRRRSR